MVNLNKTEPVKTKDGHQLTSSNFKNRTTRLGDSDTFIDPSKLSVVSQNYLKFRNTNGFRPLVIHPTITNCLPYKAAREKRQAMLNDLFKERLQIISAIEVDIKDKAREECRQNIAHYTELYNQATDSVKKMNYQSMIEAEKRYLKTLEYKTVTETDLRHPDLLALDNKIDKLRSAQLHINNGGTCQSCGVSLPDSMEQHIDFITSETRLLCPFCHLTEHIDEAAELRAGYIGYMPNISQEQINLFTYCYFILKYIIEVDERIPDEIKAKLKEFAERPISSNLEDITYAKLYQEIKSIRNAMKLSGNTLVAFFKHHANIDKEHLKREYEEKNGEKFNTNIEDYLISENKKYENRKFTFKSDTFYSYNIDNMNLPEFYAGIMIANGVSIHAPTSVEEKLNIITRLDGIRFIPSYTFFKPYLASWQRTLLTTGFEAVMANFFIAFEDLINLNEGKPKPKEESENSNNKESEEKEQKTQNKDEKDLNEDNNDTKDTKGNNEIITDIAKKLNERLKDVEENTPLTVQDKLAQEFNEYEIQNDAVSTQMENHSDSEPLDNEVDTDDEVENEDPDIYGDI